MPLKHPFDWYFSLWSHIMSVKHIITQKKGSLVMEKSPNRPNSDLWTDTAVHKSFLFQFNNEVTYIYIYNIHTSMYPFFIIHKCIPIYLYIYIYNTVIYTYTLYLHAKPVVTPKIWHLPHLPPLFQKRIVRERFLELWRAVTPWFTWQLMEGGKHRWWMLHPWKFCRKSLYVLMTSQVLRVVKYSVLRLHIF